MHSWYHERETPEHREARLAKSRDYHHTETAKARRRELYHAKPPEWHARRKAVRRAWAERTGYYQRPEYKMRKASA